jgi:hypothetical protein
MTLIRFTLLTVIGLVLWLVGIWINPPVPAFFLLSVGSFLMVLAWTEKRKDSAD